MGTVRRYQVSVTNWGLLSGGPCGSPQAPDRPPRQPGNEPRTATPHPDDDEEIGLPGAFEENLKRILEVNPEARDDGVAPEGSQVLALARHLMPHTAKHSHGGPADRGRRVRRCMSHEPPERHRTSDLAVPSRAPDEPERALQCFRRV